MMDMHIFSLKGADTAITVSVGYLPQHFSANFSSLPQTHPSTERGALIALRIG